VVVLSLKLDHPLGTGIDDFLALSWDEYPQKMQELFPESYQVITETYSGFEKIEQSMQNYEIKNTLDTIFSLLSDLNKFADSETPWSLIKTDPEKAEIILYVIARRLVLIGVSLYPFFPQKMDEMFTKFGLEKYGELLESG
jgi:methionyl-tRNA synthetase